MNTYFFKRLFGLALVIFSLVLVFGFKILDPQSSNPLLRQIAQKLHDRGIDVIQDWKSNADTEGRPVLAPLANYRLPDETNGSIFEQEWVNQFSDWVDAYHHEDLEIILAAQDNMPGSFRVKWDRVSTERRIFISFSREDEFVASEVRTVLEQSGYTVFTFLNGSEVELSAEKIAYYMTTSGNRLVIDTEGARIKSGVLAESLAEAKYQFAYSTNLAERIQSIKEQITNTDFSLEDWVAANPTLTEQELSAKMQQTKSKLLVELEREQTSGRIQTEILVKVLSAISICPYYHVPKIACPICAPTVLLH